MGKASQKKPEPVLTLTEAEFATYAEDATGVCIACGELHDSPVEPDAENYECYGCGAHKVCGVEQALVAGYIELE